ncbi:MAG: hypothetical protein QM811_17615 [Pirellulales bacterium]
MLKSAKIKGPLEMVILEYEPWQQLLAVQTKLAEYLRQIGEPPAE